MALIAVKGTQLDIKYSNIKNYLNIFIISGIVEILKPSVMSSPTKIEGPIKIKPPEIIKRDKWDLIYKTNQMIEISNNGNQLVKLATKSDYKEDWIRKNLSLDKN